MDKRPISVDQYPEFEGVSVPNQFWDTIWLTRPARWNEIPYDVRAAIEQGIVDCATQLFTDTRKNYYNYAGFTQGRTDELAHSFALTQIHNMLKAQLCEWCWDELDKRQDAIEANERVYCGARRKNGVMCKAKAEKGKNRCRFHGGQSTGPKTIETKLKSLANLPQYRNNPVLLEAKRQRLLSEAA